MLDISVIWAARDPFFQAAVIWVAKNNALQEDVIQCFQVPKNSKNEQGVAKNEQHYCFIWLIPRMSDGSDPYQKELSQSGQHRQSNKPKRLSGNVWRIIR